MMQRFQMYAVSKGATGEGKSPGVNSAIERAGEGGTVLDSLVGLKGSTARGETGLKDSPREQSIGDTKLGRWKTKLAKEDLVESQERNGCGKKEKED
jgi:hypothetical protein